MKLKRLLRCESGTSLVELAIALPFLAMLLVGLIDVGRFAYYSILAANAARAGAQYGMQNLETAYDTGGIASAAAADGENLPNWTASGGGSSAGGITVNQLCAPIGSPPQACPTPWGSTPPEGTIYYVQVQVTGTFAPLVSYPGLPAQLPISGSATIRVARQ